MPHDAAFHMGLHCLPEDRFALICIYFIKSELFSLAIEMDADRMVTIYLINVLAMV